MRIPWKKALVIASALAVSCAMLTAQTAGGAPRRAGVAAKNFTILHTNDEHSEIIPYSLAKDYPDHPTIGGFSRLARTIGAIKTSKADAGEPVLTLSAGDWSQGTLFSWLETSAAPELTLMQQIGYDAAAIGNHDVELGPQYAAALLNAAKGNGVNLPLLSANIKFSGTPPDPGSPDASLYSFYSATDRQRSDLYIQPYTTRILPNGLKVGIFGMLGVEAEQVAPGMTPLTFGNVPGDDATSFLNRVGVAMTMVNTLRTAESCDVVVCLSHMGTEEEKLLATVAPGIDVIVGGHSHDLNYPPITSGGTIIVQAGSYSEHLGELELRYDPGATGAKVTVRGARAIRMDETVETVPAVDAVINSFLTGLNTILGFDCLAAYAETDVKGNRGFALLDVPPMAETAIGDLIADTYRSAANRVDPAHPVDFALEANGVIRSGVAKGASGVFSFYDLYRVLPLGASPYDSTTPGFPIVAFYLYGAEIEGVMNRILDLGRNDFFMQVSGLKYGYDPTAPEGKRLLSLAVDDGSGKYEAVSPTRLYRLAANYYTGAFLGIFGLFPRDRTGAQHKPPAYPDPMESFILKTGMTSELKCWQALTGGVANMPDLDGDGLPNVPLTYQASQERANRLARSYYFAEGNCRPEFNPYLAIQNTEGDDVKVRVTYMTGQGGSKTQDILLKPHSRGTLHPPDILGTGIDAAHEFSAEVECEAGSQIVAERPMYFNYGERWTGGHDVLGALDPAGAFYFAEGTCRPMFDPYVTIQNPGEADAAVRITYMKGDGTTDTQDLTVVKASRATVVVRDKLGAGDDEAHDFSAKVECVNGQEIVAERPMYFNYKGEWTGGSVVMGTASPSAAVYFAEGSCRPGFDAYFTIQNPGATDSSVRITYMKGDSSIDVQELTVSKHSRETVVVKDRLGEGDDPAHDFSALVETTNNVPIVAERPMYFDYNGWTGGHDVMGVPAPQRTFDFAEGTCRPGFDAYISVLNPSGGEARVKVTYQLGDGSVKTQEMALPAHSRRTFHPRDVIGVGDDAAHDFSARVQCTNGLPIVAERPMYFDYHGWTGGSCVTGY